MLIFNFIKTLFNNKVISNHTINYSNDYYDNNTLLDYCTICDLLHINNSFMVHCKLCNKCHIRNYINCRHCNNCYDVHKENDIIKHRKLCNILSKNTNY